MKIALTGANGFLGSYIAKAYLNDGHEVIALVRASADCSSLPTNTNLHLEKINYKDSLESQFDELKKKQGEIDLFIHNAGVTVSLNNQEYFDINTHLTGKIISAVESTGWVNKDGKLVYVSSLTAQGPVGINIPVSKYGESKLKAEEFFKNSTIPELIIRPTGIYGAGDYAFLPLFKGAKAGLYPLTRKTQKMSMIHGADLAKIILEESKTSIGTIHASDGNSYSHEDFISALKNATGKKIAKIPFPAWLSKLFLGLSDVYHNLIKKRPGLTKEKFQEITMDWDVQEREGVLFSKVACEISLEEGFQDAYNFYKEKKLL